MLDWASEKIQRKSGLIHEFFLRYLGLTVLDPTFLDTPVVFDPISDSSG